MTDQKQRAVFWWCAIFSLILFWAVVLLLVGCGEAQCGGGCVLVGDWTEEEAAEVTKVTAAFREVFGTEPNALVNFVHSPDAWFRGGPWKDYRLPGVEARNEEEGYRGLWDQEWCMVLVRRYGEARPHLRSLLIHELLHAMGYIHGSIDPKTKRSRCEEMCKAEEFVLEYLTLKQEEGK